MKQANQNIIIDEATMEFSQSVLFSHLSDSLPSTHTARWGEQDTNRTTDSDGITEEQGTETNDGDTQNHAENKEEMPTPACTVLYWQSVHEQYSEFLKTYKNKKKCE
jgi:hypothetical protein